MNIAENPWEDPDSPWATEAAFRAWKRGGYRRMWSKYPLKLIFIRNNRFKAPLGRHDKMVWAGDCNICKNTFRTGQLQVDHIHPNPPLADGEEEYLKNLFVTQTGMQFACKTCHDCITLAERKGISFSEAKKEKAVIKIMKRPAEGQKQWLKAKGVVDKDMPKNTLQRRKAIQQIIHNE